MDPDRDLVLQTFVAQSEEGLSKMEESLIELEARPADDEALNEIFRVCHTLKGDSAILGFSRLANFAHTLEDLLERLRARAVSVTGELVTLLLESVDALRELVEDSVGECQVERSQHTSLLDRIRERSAAETHEPDGEPNPAGQTPQADPEEPEPARTGGTYQTFRVRVETIDRLLDLTGELAISRSRVQQLLIDGARSAWGELLEAHEAMDQLFSSLQEEVMKIRMVPIGPVFRQHLRTVRDLAAANGKEARLEIEGQEAELDATVIEHIRDPLGHVIRNAIAHGIESPEERRAAGKDPCGQVTLRAWHEGASIVVQVADDGRGLDHARIQERAEELGLAPDPTVLSASELEELIFEPGLSTAQGATLASGRGVGMDVVRRNIEALHGSVRAESVAGQGSTFTIRLPLTLAIIDGFVVGAGSETYVLPLNTVVECLDLPPDVARRIEPSGVIGLRGVPLPYLRLRDAFDSPGEAGQREKIVVIRHGGEQAGIAVDSIYGERQAVIKPLERFFHDLPGIAGATILGDGQVALILDIPALLRQVISQHDENRPQNLSGSRKASESAPTSACP